MQVALLTNLFPTPGDPNRGIFTLHLARALREQVGLRVICPLPWFPKVGFAPLPERWRRLGGVPYRYEIDGIEVTSPKYPLIPRLSEHFHHRLMAPALRRAIRDLNTSGPRLDLVNTHYFYPDAVAAQLATEWAAVPHVATGLGSDINRHLDSPHIRNETCKALQRCDAITVVASQNKERLLRECPGLDVEVVLNGVDHKRFRPMPRKEARNAVPLTFDERPVVIWIGRLSAEKNPLLLLQAAKRLAASGPPLRFLVLGSGTLERLLRDYIATHDLAGSVELVGERPHTEVRAWLNAADLLALTSDCEGCPNVVLEALACGTPVVATDVGSIPDVIVAANGRRVPIGDDEALARAMAEHLANGPYNRQEVAATVQHLSWTHAAEQYRAIYEPLYQQR